MIDWIAGDWNEPWRCLVDHAGVYRRPFAGLGDGFRLVRRGPVRLGQQQRLGALQPRRYSTQWKKPMLVIHGGKDFRVPTEQGIAAYNAARRAGAPTQLVIFPDENHWVLKPQNSVQWYRFVEDWMDRWTGNTPPGVQAAAATK